MPGNNSDRSVAAHTDPEHTRKVLEEFYLEADLALQTRTWLEGDNRLKDGPIRAKGSRSLALDFAELQSIEQLDETYEPIVEAHHALIKKAVGSGPTSYRRHHSSGLLEYIRQLGLIVPDPDYDSVRSDTAQLHLFSDLSSRQEPEPGPDQEYWKLSLDQLRDEAMQTPPFGADATVVQRINYRRSSAVRIYVMKRADGRCEGCESPAPFIKRDSKPYLEAHHTQRVSDEGPDHPEWVIALCPTCHRRVHHANDGQDYNVCLKRKAKQLELMCMGKG